MNIVKVNHNPLTSEKININEGNNFSKVEIELARQLINYYKDKQLGEEADLNYFEAIKKICCRCQSFLSTDYKYQPLENFLNTTFKEYAQKKKK